MIISHVLYQKYLKGGMFMLMMFMLASCYDKETLNVPQKENEDLIANELDEYIDQNFVQKYGMAVRYRYVDSYLSPGQRVTPVKLDAVRPMLDFIEEYWAQPFLEVENGAEFFYDHVPAEVILFGGLIYQGGTVLLGVAEAGARITLLNVNDVDPNDQDWILFQLGTIYHEFAHVVHQRYKLPTGFENVSPIGYTGPGSWFILTDDEALERGFVSPYGTSSVNEDFAEIVAFYLFDPEFHERFTIDEECTTVDCERRNEGRAKLRQKLSLIADHYEKVTGINLEELRAATQSKIVVP
ncbi:substrate import-associated zinc metallohydrolase lipoprotein [Marinoscillum sp. MHG1-6]|uniref:substrate import-associated zinc metallohydrolase lipoprotein n=1 Tax=Marinoscillum sp. MHG1-6 TaxID=2959627 RepID=UPI002157E287|nr:substrate import-associated zinc metallohydrolase lipoprotein [Marinoscillum sp. MHG1-6]